MANKVLIDVNVCLDFLLKREPFSVSAGNIFQAIEDKRFRAYVSAISFDTIFYILRPAMGAVKATRLLRDFTLHLNIATADHQVIYSALNSKWKDLEDAIHYQSAKNAGCNSIITRNGIDFKQASLPILSPQEFLEQLAP